MEKKARLKAESMASLLFSFLLCQFSPITYDNLILLLSINVMKSYVVCFFASALEKV